MLTVDGNDESGPAGTQDSTATVSQIAPQSGETHYSSPRSGNVSNNEVSSDLFATVPSQQILSLTEVRMSELIEGPASIQSAFLLAENPLATQALIPSKFNLSSLRSVLRTTSVKWIKY